MQPGDVAQMVERSLSMREACGDLLFVEIGKRAHGEIVLGGLESDIYVAKSLLAMYLRFEDIEAARAMFDRMRERNLASWNTMIFGYARNGKAEEALLGFQEMKKDGLVVDGMTLLPLLTALSNLRGVKQGKEAHAHAVWNGKNFATDLW
ncbi:hypothetical protein NL676_017583 [Syzygium grande]|nr:hypothetical protein NL676_017583 [Syzygium grande]